ncbi:fanconi anemia group J protein [Tanacetum coccineum]
MWTVMLEKEVNIDMGIVRNLSAVARDLIESLNRRQAIINESKINKNTTMVKSAAFFKAQQDQDLAFKKGSSLIVLKTLEPRGAQEDFENVLKDYYDTIRQGNKPTTTGERVSEGIDFSDENARAVIIVGIPFPNVYDIKVSEKKKYNDAYKSSKGLLSGNEWYCQQAFRALNQAAGRCIRHRLDYGAIIFLDERFRQERNLAYLSKWLRNSIRQYDDFGQSLEGLKSFFRDIKVESKASSTQPVDVKPIDVEESKNWFTEMKNSKVTKINSKGSNVVAAPQVATKIDKWSVLTKKYDCSLVKKESKGPEERTANKSDKNTGVAYIDLETENRCSSPPSMNISHDDFEPTVVAETPNYNEPLTVKKEPINEAYSTTVDVKPIDVEESKSCFTEMKNSKVTKINSKGSNGVAASEVATRINKCAVPTKKYDCSLLKTESKGPEERTANKNDKTTGAAYIDLETENRCSSLPSMNISHDDFEPTVAETPNYNEPLTVKKEPINEAYSTTVESVSEVDFSHSTIIQTNFPHQQLPHSFTSPCSTSASAFNTPKKQHISHNKSPLYSSVNSHVHKRRKFSASETVKMEQYDSPDPKTPKEIKQFSVPQSCILDVPEASSTTCGDVTKKELKISCSLCRNPLGLVENNYFVSCSVTSLSMVHLATIWKGIATGPTSVPVVVSDISSVDRRILERTSECGIGQGIWSKEDCCVFNTIFCTFCNNQDTCLGLHVVATDSANVQFLNKLLFYSDRLEIQHIEASVNSKEVSPSSVTRVSKSPVQNPFEKFAYVPPETNSSGWRTTKSKSFSGGGFGFRLVVVVVVAGGGGGGWRWWRWMSKKTKGSLVEFRASLNVRRSPVPTAEEYYPTYYYAWPIYIVSSSSFYVSSSSFSQVCLLQFQFACKLIAKRKLVTDDDVVDVRKEVEIMHHLSGHPNVVSIKGAYEDSYDVHLVMELCCGGVMRLNLKPENFLFVDKGEDSFLKAIDFGLSVFFKPGDIFTDIVGSPYYVALEVLLRHYGFEIDIRSAGVILYILLSGVPPFWGETENDVFKEILQGELDFSFDLWPVISERYVWICVHGVALDKPLDHAVLTRLTQFFVINKLKKMALKELKDGLKNYGADLDESSIRDLMLSVMIGSAAHLSYSKSECQLCLSDPILGLPEELYHERHLTIVL